jgi:hypothetical protein
VPAQYKYREPLADWAENEVLEYFISLVTPLRKKYIQQVQL